MIYMKLSDFTWFIISRSRHFTVRTTRNLLPNAMDRTSEFIELTGSGDNLFTQLTSDGSPFIFKAMETYTLIDTFEHLLRECYDSFASFHRYLPSKEKSKMQDLSESNRSAISKEVLVFISSTASKIQELNRLLDEKMSNSEEMTMHLQHYRLIISSVLQKLSAFTALSDRMQKEYRRNTLNPFRLMSDRYAGCVKDTKEGEDPETEPDMGSSSTIKNFFFGDEVKQKEAAEEPASVPVVLRKANTGQDSFAQRYIDEIASQSKLKEYESVAHKQKESLLKEARILKVRFSEEIRESQKMERTVGNISSMINEFSQLIESQSGLVDTIAEVSQDTTASVKSADAELLLTLERSQSHQYSMIFFIAGMSVLLLLLDFLTP